MLAGTLAPEGREPEFRVRAGERPGAPSLAVPPGRRPPYSGRSSGPLAGPFVVEGARRRAGEDAVVVPVQEPGVPFHALGVVPEDHERPDGLCLVVEEDARRSAPVPSAKDLGTLTTASASKTHTEATARRDLVPEPVPTVRRSTLIA